MVTTKLQGGLGNQLFMMAQLIGHSLKYNLEYFVPLKVDNPHYKGQQLYLFNDVQYANQETENLQLPLYNEPHYHYAEIPKVDNVCFNGYWQSFKYINGFRKQILKTFDFEYQRDEGWCAIHVRRGDYLQLPQHHPFVGEEYLRQAISIMNGNGINKFRVFSNDQQWCSSFFVNEKFNGSHFHLIIGKNEIQDLERGSYCEHQILSNGTFALWMHYLNQNPNKMCIAPKRWFGSELPHNTDDLYPENCIKI